MKGERCYEENQNYSIINDNAYGSFCFWRMWFI